MHDTGNQTVMASSTIAFHSVCEPMERLVSSWFAEKTLPKSYVLPPEKRPGEISVPACQIPVIDLSMTVGHDRANVIQQIMQAGKHFGFFQVINHGVPKEVMADTMRVCAEFFELPYEDKSYLYTEESNEICKLYTSSYNYAREDIHYWRDCLKHNCTPLKECIEYWPQKPARYREVVGEYSAHVRELGLRLVDLIGEGLGLEPGYFANGLSADAFLVVNHYPPCPDPRLTLGLPRHCDPNLITLLLQDVPGLQVLVDDEWLLVEPCPDAFVVNMGYQFQIISNGKLKSAEHRVVTNARNARTAPGIFIKPSIDCTVEPAKALIGPNDPPRYKPFQYSEFLKTYTAYNGDFERVLEPYKIKA